MVRGIVVGVDDALAKQPSANWSSLVRQHEDWRIARGERLTYKPKAQVMNPPAVPVSGPSTVKSSPSVWLPGQINRIWALCVGISKYQHNSVPPLPYARKDAQAIKAWLTGESGPGIPPENVQMLLDEQATRANILDKIDWLRRVAMPEDLVIIYFSCHGAPELMSDGSGFDAKYLVTHDTDPDRLLSTGQPFTELTERLNVVEAKVQVVILESCYAGEVGRRLLDKAATADLTILPKAIENMGTRPGRIILSASSGRQVAISSQELQGSLFTHYLLKNLGNGTKPLVGGCFEKTWDDVRRKAKALTAALQEPQKLGDANVDVIFKATD